MVDTRLMDRNGALELTLKQMDKSSVLFAIGYLRLRNFMTGKNDAVTLSVQATNLGASDKAILVYCARCRQKRSRSDAFANVANRIRMVDMHSRELVRFTFRFKHLEHRVVSQSNGVRNLCHFLDLLGRQRAIW